MKIDEIIFKPVLTEKSTSLLKNNFYMFEVGQKATKPKIKNAIERLYTVKVATIKITNRQGKMRKVGRKQAFKQLPSRKIAFIKLKEGKIDLFPKA